MKAKSGVNSQLERLNDEKIIVDALGLRELWDSNCGNCELDYVGNLMNV